MSPSLFFLNEDARILDQIRKGEEEALVRLYDLNKRQVASFVVRNNGAQTDAEDMLQEALIVLWERVRSGHYQHEAKISTFIFATVKNMWFRRLARTRREVTLDTEVHSIAIDDQSALEAMIETEDAKSIASALDKLGNPCRELLLLYYWQELSMEQIARQMGFANSDTAKSKKYQCKKALTKLLQHTR